MFATLAARDGAVDDGSDHRRWIWTATMDGVLFVAGVRVFDRRAKTGREWKSFVDRQPNSREAIIIRPMSVVGRHTHGT